MSVGLVKFNGRNVPAPASDPETLELFKSGLAGLYRDMEKVLCAVSHIDYGYLAAGYYCGKKQPFHGFLQVLDQARNDLYPEDGSQTAVPVLSGSCEPASEAGWAEDLTGYIREFLDELEALRTGRGEDWAERLTGGAFMYALEQLRQAASEVLPWLKTQAENNADNLLWCIYNLEN
jgi:hypothetical protein